MRLGAAFVLVGLCAGAARAATPETFSVSFEGGYQGLTNAPDSAKAVFGGATGGAVFGGSVRVRVWRSVFVGAGVRSFSKTGERVFVDGPGGAVFKLGHPLKVRLRPVDAFVGYRFRPGSALVPYLAAGAGVTSYREESTVAGLTDSASESKTSWHVALGADYALGRLGLGFEARYTSLPDVIGLGGVSKVYGETDLGGLSIVGRLSFRH